MIQPLIPCGAPRPGACLRLAFRQLCLSALLVTAAVAQTAPTPGVPNVQRTPGQLVVGPIMPQQGRLTILNWHNGILYSSPESVESGGATVNGVVKSATGDYGTYTGYAWDLNQMLANPTVLPTPLAAYPGMFNGYQAHGSMHWNDSTGSYALVSPRYFKAGAYGTNSSVASPMPAGHNQFQRGMMFPPFTFNTWWVSYGAMDGNLVFRRDGQTLVSWNHQDIAGTMDQGVLMGNWLIQMSTSSNRGVAIYDMRNQMDGNPATDAIEPPLLGLLTEGGFGGYWPEITGWQGKLLAVGGNRNIAVADISDPTHPTFVGKNNFGGSHATYPTFQDQFAFLDGRKVDLSQPGFPVVLTVDHNATHTIPGINTGSGISTSQFNLAIGNLLVTGGLDTSSSSSKQGMAIFAHQAAPDTKGPEIGFHVPRAGETDYPVRAPLSFAIPETLEMTSLITGGMTSNVANMTIIVRPLGGTPVAATISRSSGSIITFTPTQALADHTTYEVVFPQGGIKDAVGNGIDSAYSFTFSTGSTVGGNQPPVINTVSASPQPVAPGSAVTLSATASDPNPGDTLQYRINFADGTTTDWGSSSSWTRSYASEGHYRVTVQARDHGGAVSSRQLTVTIGAVPSGTRPTSNSQIVMHPGSGRIYVVNPDSDSVTIINPSNNSRESTISLGDGTDPRSVAVAADGKLWVTCFGDDTIRILDTSNNHSIQTLALAYGAAPFAVAMNPAGTQAFVTYHGTGQLARFSTASPTTAPALCNVGASARAIAINGAASRVFVTKFISGDDNFGTVWEVNPSTMALTRTIRLPMETNKWSGDDSMGSPNYLSSITISPDNSHAYITAKKDVMTAGKLFGDGDRLLQADRTVRTTLRAISLSTNAEVVSRRIDLDNSDSPSSVAFTPLGDYLLVAQQGNNLITVLDHYQLPFATNLGSMVGRTGVGLAPQGMLFDSSNNRLYVHNFMGRTVSVLDGGALVNNGSASMPTLATIDTLASGTEKLSATVLSGKRAFYNASATDASGQNAMSGETYMSCASCHFDGGHDGRTWDFTQRGEGLRNTTDLRGRRGMAHGNVHWSANFDEIQDFVNDIVLHGSGTGFLPAGQSPHPPLGTANAGRAAELDDLAAYVSSLNSATVPKSPERTASGALTADAVAGQSIFTAQSCTTCHDPDHGFTNSSLGTLPTLADVGTHRRSSGNRLDQHFAGVDTPTLAGIFGTAPYFHDGSAKTLEDVFVVAGGSIYQAEDGVRSPTGTSIDTYVFINGGNASFGRSVRLSATGASVTFNPVDGGTGGTGMIEMRVGNSSSSTYSATLTVNGTNQPVSIPPNLLSNNFGTVRVDGVTLAAGTANTVVFTVNQPNTIVLDQIVVSTPHEIAKAFPHRKVLGLSAQHRSELIAYIRQLDGSDLSDTSTPKTRSGPLASDDSFMVTEKTSPQLHVLANDSGTGLTVSSVGPTSLGTTRIVNNQVEYTPFASVWSGGETFRYAVRDSSGMTHWSDVQVTISEAAGSDPLPMATFPNIYQFGSAQSATTRSRIRGWDGYINLATTTARGINGDGSGLDSLLFAAKRLEGNFRATVRLRSLEGASTARAGIMIRDTKLQGSRYVYLASSPDAGYRQRARNVTVGTSTGGAEAAASTGGTDAVPAKWLRLQRIDNVITLFTSADGVTFQQAQSHAIAGLGYHAQVGLFAFAGTSATPADAAFSDYQVEALPTIVNLDSGLLLHLDFEDTNQLGKDDSGASRHATVFGVPSSSTDAKSGSRSLFFPVSEGNFLTVPHDEGFNTSSYTISSWWKTSYATGAFTGGNTDIVGTSVQSGGSGVRFEGHRDGAWAKVEGKNAFSSNYFLNTGSIATGNTEDTAVLGQTWYHMALAVDNATKQIRYYINGDFKLLVTVSSDNDFRLMSPGHLLRIGRSHAEGAFSSDHRGWLDDVRVYNRPLTGAEIGALAGAAQPAPNDVLDSLAGRWNFEGNTQDVSGASGISGVLGGGAALASGGAVELNGSLNLTSVSSRMVLSNFVRPTGAFTYSMWMRPEAEITSASARQELLFGVTENVRPHITINQNTTAGAGRVGFFHSIGGASQVYTNARTWNANEWYHLTFTYDGSAVKVFVNGAEESSSSRTGAYTSAAGMVMGARDSNGTNRFNGNMDDVRVYTRALTSDEVMRVYQNPGAGETPPPPVQTAPQITSQPVALTLTSGQTATFTAAASGEPAPSLQWQENTSGNWRIIAGATSVTLDVGVVGASNAGSYRMVATNSAGTATSNEALLTVQTVSLTPLQTWRQENFGTTANIGTAADTYDYDGDGAANLLEYALGTAPDSATSRPVLNFQISDSKLQISFLRARADVTYEVLASSGFATWSVLATNPGEVGMDVTVRDSVSLLNTPSRFMRLRVTNP